MCSFVCVKSWDCGGRVGAIWGLFHQGDLVTSLNVHLTRSSLASLFKMANFGDIGVVCHPQSLRTKTARLNIAAFCKQ